ncbi:MAG: NUDIX domain-containing protein [Gemmataceae bacterium]
MPKKSAGLLMYRQTSDGLEVLLVHPGGPFWTNKDEGAWTIPKGLIEEGEEPLGAAKREFAEETGCAPTGEFVPLDPVKQAGGKIVHAWAIRGNFELANLKSNSFSMEWPLKSGKYQSFPEVDRAGWFSMEEARRKILNGQLPLLEQLELILQKQD